MNEIAHEHFGSLKGPPAADNLGYIRLDTSDFEYATSFASEDAKSSDLSYGAWLCFPVEEINFGCSEDEEPEYVMPFLFAIDDGIRYEFVVRHNYGKEWCEQMVNDWKALLDGVDTACVLGFGLQREVVTPENIVEWSVIDRVKTRRGHWSYFLENKTP